MYSIYVHTWFQWTTSEPTVAQFWKVSAWRRRGVEAHRKHLSPSVNLMAAKHPCSGQRPPLFLPVHRNVLLVNSFCSNWIYQRKDQSSALTKWEIITFRFCRVCYDWMVLGSFLSFALLLDGSHNGTALSHYGCQKSKLLCIQFSVIHVYSPIHLSCDYTHKYPTVSTLLSDLRHLQYFSHVENKNQSDKHVNVRNAWTWSEVSFWGNWKL